MWMGISIPRVAFVWFVATVVFPDAYQSWNALVVAQGDKMLPYRFDDRLLCGISRRMDGKEPPTVFLRDHHVMWRVKDDGACRQTPRHGVR